MKYKIVGLLIYLIVTIVIAVETDVGFLSAFLWPVDIVFLLLVLFLGTKSKK